MTNQVTELLQQGLVILLQIGLLAVVAGLLWIRKQLTMYIQSHTTVQERAFLERVGKEAFTYAETVFGALDGPAKLNEATKYMLDVLNQHGMNNVPMKDIRAIIEQAWLEDRRKSGKPVEKPSSHQIR